MNPTQERIVEYLKRDFLALSKSSDEEDLFMFEFLKDNGLMSEQHRKGCLNVTNEGKSFQRNAYYFNPVPLTIPDWRDNILNQLKEGQTQLNGDGKLFSDAESELRQDRLIELGETPYFRRLTTYGRQFISNNTIEDIKISILKYLTGTKSKIVVIEILNNENIDNRLFDLAKNELKESGFIKNTNNAGWIITEPGENFLTRYDFGLKMEEKQPSISIGQIGHNFTNSPVSHSNLSIEALKNSINPPSSTHPKQTKTNIGRVIFNWIISNIGTVILSVFIGIAIWYFTIYNPILTHK